MAKTQWEDISIIVNWDESKEMTEEFSPYFFIIFPFFFVGMWFLVISTLRTKSGMTKEDIGEASGPILSDSGWGSAKINGVSANNCVKLIEYERGYLLKMMFIFGDGKLWIPKGEYIVEETKPKRLFLSPEIKTISWQNNSVKLYGKLSRSIAL